MAADYVDRAVLERVERALALEPLLGDPSVPAATREFLHLAVYLARDVLKLAREQVSRADGGRA